MVKWKETRDSIPISQMDLTCSKAWKAPQGDYKPSGKLEGKPGWVISYGREPDPTSEPLYLCFLPALKGDIVKKSMRV